MAFEGIGRMNLLSMLTESIRVTNRLEYAGRQAGLDQAERFAADNCSQSRQAPADSGKYEILDSAFMRPF
jgi:hypothetical protein